MDDNQLDNFFKGHLDEYADDGSPNTAWRNMQHMLGPSAAQNPQGVFVSRSLFWGMAAVLLLLISSFLYGMWKHTLEVEALHTSIQDMREELDGRGRMAHRVDTLIVLAGADGKLHHIAPEDLDKLDKTTATLSEPKISEYVGPDRRTSTTSTFTPSIPSSHPSKNTTSNQTSTLDQQDNHTSNASQTSPNSVAEEQLPLKDTELDTLRANPKQLADQRLEPEAKKQEPKPLEEKASLAVQADSVGQKDRLDKLAQVENKAEEKKKGPGFFDKLAKQLGVRTGVEAILATGGSEYSELEAVVGAGLGLELRIGDRFALRSGARFQSLNYEIGDLSSQLLSEDFLGRFPGSTTLGPDSEIHEIKMSGTYFEIPIGLRYYYPVNDKFQAFSGIDIAGGSFLQEDFTYEVFENNRESYHKSKASNIPWHWGTGRFSLGAAFALKPKLNLEAAVFFEKDLAPRGVEDFSYYMVGLSTSVWLSQ